MAKLFGYPINVEPEGGGGSSSANAEPSRSGMSAGLPQRETNPYSRFPESGSSAPVDNRFIDFFGIESNEIETVGVSSYTGRRSQAQQRVAARDDVEVALGLGIGAASGGDSVTGNKETDSGRVVVVGADLTDPLGDDLFCEEEAVLMADDEGGVQSSLVTRVESEEDELAFLSPVNNIHDFYEDFYQQSADDIMREAMDVDAELFLPMFPRRGEETRGAYADVFAEPFDQELPPPLPTIRGTRPASKRVVDDLPVVEITSEELSKGKIVCAVCTGEVVVEEKVTRLPCWHYYHGDCIVPWLGMKNTCPVCRFQLPTD